MRYLFLGLNNAMNESDLLSEANEQEKQVMALMASLKENPKVDKDFLEKAEVKFKQSFSLLKMVITNADLETTIV